MYCAIRIPAHLRCTQCSILLHLIDICFLTCICLWQISQIQTCLCEVVGPGLVLTSPAFMRSIASHPAGLHACTKNSNRAPIGGDTICTGFATVFIIVIMNMCIECNRIVTGSQLAEQLYVMQVWIGYVAHVSNSYNIYIVIM